MLKFIEIIPLFQGAPHERAPRLQVPSTKKAQAPDEEGTEVRLSNLASDLPLPGEPPDAQEPDAPNISPLRPAPPAQPRPGEPKNLPIPLPPAPLSVPVPAPGRIQIRNGTGLIVQQRAAVSFRF